MKPYVVFDDDGRILQTGIVPDAMLDLQKGSGRNVIEGVASDLTDYVSNGQITARPANSVALTGRTLSNLPVPCTIHINDSSYACSDTSADLSFTYSGTYKVRVEAFPFLDAEFTVIV